MIFDTWGGLLEGRLYEEFSISYINKIQESLEFMKVPLIYYTREPNTRLEIIKKLNVDVIGIDSSMSIGAFRNVTNGRFCVQGNLDVNILRRDEKSIEDEVIKILESYNHNSGHIFNLGTGITPDINPEKVKFLIDVLEKVSPRYTMK